VRATVRFNHLALPVRDQARSRRFYEEFFGFAAGPAQRYPDGVLIVRNAEGFDLALGAGDASPPAPAPFFHFGFRVAAPERVRAVRARLAAAEVAIVETVDAPELVSVKCADPDGYVVEVYWEAPA
jgi:catechol 2,3-dioxygenase-like lactoylglutathione lyase family enzyme